MWRNRRGSKLHRRHCQELTKTEAWKAWSRSGTRPIRARRSTSSEAWRSELRLSLPPGGSVLERSARPWSTFSIELAKLGSYSITGLDISHTFVEIASKKAGEAGVHVDFRQGNASRMPFADDTFDFLLCRAAFKNFGQPVRALQEMCRVLKPCYCGADHQSRGARRP